MPEVADRMHHPEFLTGVIAPMFTPVDRSGQLSLPGIHGMVDYLARTGAVNTIFARSGMGQMYSFTATEAVILAETTLAAANGRVNVIAGASGIRTDKIARGGPACVPERYLEQAVRLTQKMEHLGIQAAVHVMPEAYTPREGETTEDAYYRYFRSVHDATNIPLVIYQPGSIRAENRMTTALLSRLLELPRIAGMKVSTSSDDVFVPLADSTRGSSFSLIAGDETYYLKALQQGACGVIGEGCNMWPWILRGLAERFRAGDLEGARRAEADVAAALRVGAGHDHTVLWKQVMMTRGGAFEPFDRNGAAPADPDRVSRAAVDIQRLVAPWLSAD
ncbi:MAG: dihydrodipicolinate synthase family protein [Armatimonadetes bacterium]|nr:dihydrodipicolinate synthase family protein [Armatimonadota bacterium]MDE2205871.1 dihydrodipicolinate synthase family protein [Armatimonadota bacterium]